jgi:signal transduction histidine kinase
MAQKVQFVTGLLSGMIIPAIAWLIFDVLYKNLILLNKPAIPYLIAIAINLFILRYFIRNDKETAGYGLMIPTFIFAMLIFKFKL